MQLSNDIRTKNGFQHSRRQTFDASTEFENYANLFDDETRELLQKDESSRERMPSIDDLKRNGIYQPPIVNDYEKEQILQYHAAQSETGDAYDSKEESTKHTASKHNANSKSGIQSIIIDPGNSHFKQWHQSRRRTLDELESKGVLDPDFFNFDASKQQNGKVRMKSTGNDNMLGIHNADVLAASTKAQHGLSPRGNSNENSLPPIHTEMAASMSAISVMEEDEDEYEDIELYKNDLYYVLCHQIIPKSQQGVFQRMLQDNISYNLSNPLDRNERSSDDEQLQAVGAEEEILADLQPTDILNDEEIFTSSTSQPASGNNAHKKVPTAPPPTAVATPYYDNEENAMGFNTVAATTKKTDIAKVKSKLERHSKKLEKHNMMQMLNGEMNARRLSSSDDDDEEKQPELSEYEIQSNMAKTAQQQQSKSQHFGAQRSIMSLMQNHTHHSGLIVPQNTPNNARAQFLGINQGAMANGSRVGGGGGDGEQESNLFAFEPTVITEKQNPFLVGSRSDNDNNMSSKVNEKYERKNAFNISYYCIPSQIDGGIVSSSIFLPYKQWCESSIIRYTEQAGECLDQMKKESNMLEHIHRTTITKSPMQDLYDDDDDEDGFVGGGGGLLLDHGHHGHHHNDGLHQQREDHLKKLSQIDENLADIRDKLRKMFRVQQHIVLIQQQYDTYVDGVRADKQELLDILNELRERHRDCDKILSYIRESEVWLITNIANTIAERSEKIDSINRKIKVERDDQQKRRYSLIVESTKNFINELHTLIQELQRISDNKACEVERLKTSIAQMEKQNTILLQASQSSYDKVIARLFELQNHYKLPAIMESQRDMHGRCNSITSSLAVYLNKVDCRDYYNRLLELHQASIIYSDERTKIFYNTFLLLFNSIINDCMIIDEYVSTNGNSQQHDPLSLLQAAEEEEEEEINLPNDDDNKFTTSKSVSFAAAARSATQQHSKAGVSSDNIIDRAFTPVQLNPSARSTSFAPLHEEYENEVIAEMKADPLKLLNHVLHHNEFQMKFESIELLNTLSAQQMKMMIAKPEEEEEQKEINNPVELDLLRRIRILSQFGHLIPYRESVMLSVVQVITLKYKHQIYHFNFDKLAIKQFATNQCCALLAHILFAHKRKHGVLRSLKRLIRRHKKRKHGQQNHQNMHKNIADDENNMHDRNNPHNLNVFRIAALIAKCAHDINMPFAIS